MYNIYHLRGDIMKNKENEILLTPELYLEISNDKSSKIAALKQEKLDTLNKLKAQSLELKRLEEQSRAIAEQIQFAEININRLKQSKFILVIELARQKRFSKKLNKKISKDNSYIRVGDYYTDTEKSKKR